MKKFCKKLLVSACVAGLAFVAAKLLKKDSVQDKLFGLLGEDTYLAANDLVHLLCDLLMWPVDFVRALLP